MKRMLLPLLAVLLLSTACHRDEKVVTMDTSYQRSPV